MLKLDESLPPSPATVKELLAALQGVDPEATLLCQVVPYCRDGKAWRMQHEVIRKDKEGTVVLNFFNEKLMVLPK